MYYYVLRQPTKYHQMTLEEYLSASYVSPEYDGKPNSNTRVYTFENVPKKLDGVYNFTHLHHKLIKFNLNCESLRECDIIENYHTFFIPKKSGGNRRIDAPNDELMNALRDLKSILENDFKALYHTSAFAYIANRSTIKAVKRHQSNESKYFLKLDLHDFFGSTTIDFTIKMLERIYPFSEMLKDRSMRADLVEALELGFLNGGLPQGTPLSPTLTNILMIPIDYEISKRLREKPQNFVYTRYADDFLISSRTGFKFKEIEQLVTDVLNEFGAPFKLNKKKTRYGSCAGSNWNLGVMLNKDNNITIGYKNKKRFETMLFNFGKDTLNNKHWDIQEVNHLQGLISYYKMVEGDVIDKIIAYESNKVGGDIKIMIKQALHP